MTEHQWHVAALKRLNASDLASCVMDVVEVVTAIAPIEVVTPKKGLL